MARRHHITLAEARKIADTLSKDHTDQWVWFAFCRLLDAQENKTSHRDDARVERLEEECKQRGLTAVPRLSALFPF